MQHLLQGKGSQSKGNQWEAGECDSYHKSFILLVVPLNTTERISQLTAGWHGKTGTVSSWSLLMLKAMVLRISSIPTKDQDRVTFKNLYILVSPIQIICCTKYKVKNFVLWLRHLVNFDGRKMQQTNQNNYTSFLQVEMPIQNTNTLNGTHHKEKSYKVIVYIPGRIWNIRNIRLFCWRCFTGVVGDCWASAWATHSCSYGVALLRSTRFSNTRTCCRTSSCWEHPYVKFTIQVGPDTWAFVMQSDGTPVMQNFFGLQDFLASTVSLAIFLIPSTTKAPKYTLEANERCLLLLISRLVLQVWKGSALWQVFFIVLFWAYLISTCCSS